MNKEQASTSGATSGAGGETNQEITQNTKAKTEDTVAYESYVKVLEEAKAAKKKLKEFEEEKKLKLDEELKAKENWKALLEQREKELGEIKDKYSGLQSGLQNAQKMQAVLKHISGEVPQQYWNLIELDKVVVNPETGEPDAMSVQNYAKEFESKYSLVVQKPNANKLPNNAPNGTGAKISYDEWLKLPAKEMAAKLKDVIS